MKINKTLSHCRFAKAVLTLVILMLCTASLAAESQTVSSAVRIHFTEIRGTRELDLTDTVTTLQLTRSVIPGTIPGNPVQFLIQEDTVEGGRLHYSAHGASVPLKIVVHTITDIPEGALLVEIAGDFSASSGAGDFGAHTATPIALGPTIQDLVTGIGNCFTGTGMSDGPLLKYTVTELGYGFSGDVVIEYQLVEDI